MEKFIVHGGKQLEGSVNISGSKNAALPILAATLLTREQCVIRRVPDVSDTNYMLQILQNLGAEVERASGNVVIKCEKLRSHEAPYDLVRKMRASVCVMGPLLARHNRASVSLPGGCVIGDRPIDLHLRGLEGLGAEATVEGGNVHLEARYGLTGKVIDMSGKHGATVLGTDNVMMAAVLAKGTTVITGAACEPEVVDLANFLNAMGAKITGAGTPRIQIEGVSELGGVEHTVIPDRIEAGTFMIAGAMAAKESITIKRVVPEHLSSLTEVLRRCGCKVETTKTTVTVSRAKNPVGANITTEPYPGFPTDMQAQMCALFATTPGMSVVRDTIFPQRFMHASEMKRMGANIEVDDGTAIINGVAQLSAAPVMASDLRASAALVLSALTAKGNTEISRVYHIDRGYEHIDEKLINLGAEIERLPA
ncbi:MAG: UDP-N-acetylglucosamine 1-carboxyvinyltransferase [Verrucomicrobiales bacterium]|nr:UDP-N-acetylglucosamine 1-carboxyvinyltransferase [Verrucomicrobiales bacterium]HQW30155.1 UDP-N-acetylglucosamine 1-carboxyvinyltransferase [Verrucomicrobiales bacterium]